MRIARRLIGRQSRSASGRRPRSGSGRGARGLRLRVRRLVLRGVLLLILLWLVGGYLLVAQPTVNRPVKVDAILVLGSPLVDDRLQTATRLIDQHLASTLVVSVSSPDKYGARPVCQHQPAGYRVVCFSPSPATTQGEAREIGRLVRTNHWTSIMVVTSRYHVSRARLIIDRCVQAKVLMVAAPGHPSAGTWVYQFLYQSGAFVKAVIQPGC